jgi:RNA polymerase sigma factor (sigma-70 family)
MMRCLRQLKPIDQKILVLRYVNQLSHQETASIMNISEAHSRVLQYRALKKLRALMKTEG